MAGGPSGQDGLTLKGQTGVVRSVAFSPDGRRVVSGSLDTTQRVWDAQIDEDALPSAGTAAP